MKKIYVLLVFILSALCTNAQISIKQNEMPNAGDSARYTTASINLFLNYGATGANHTWNFSNLRAASQDIQQYLDVSTTNFVYALVFANIPFFTNRSNVSSNTTEFPTSPIVPLTNPYNFYYRNSSQYKQTGFGAEIAGLPIPVTLNNHDIIYNLPVNYGDVDTSLSDWNINVPGVGDLGYWQTRINEVDGWGTLTTPHNTYNVLRVKTTRLQKDTVALDTLGGFAVDRPLVREYKWLATSEIIPVMQVTTQEIFGVEVITAIFFRDDFIKIEANALASSVYCAGTLITIPFTKYGTFNGAALFSTANVFTAQLSDSSGSFANPVAIGNVTANQSGIINATLPATTLPGIHYRIRVVSSNLPVEGTDNGTDIVIVNSAPVINNITSNGSLNFCAGDSVVLSIDQGDYYTYQWLTNGTAISGATSPTYTAALPGNYTVEVTNACGTVISTPAIVTIQPMPTAAISNTTLNPCKGDTIIINSITTDVTAFQWQLNGVNIIGAVNADIAASQNGIYTLVASGICGTQTSNALTITFATLPVAASITAATTAVCSGDSILLTATVSGFSMQWQLNNVDIGGAVTADMYALANGVYTLISTNNCGSSISNAIALTFLTAPLAATIIPSSVTACAGDSILLNATIATGNLQWQLNGVDIIGAITANLFAFADGNYTLITGNNCGSSTSNSVSLAFASVPVAAIVTAASAIACAGDSILITASGVTGLVLQWQLNNIDIPNATDSIMYATFGGDYTLVVSNNCGSAISTVVSITIYPLPTQPVIIQSNDTLYASLAVAYQWYYNGNIINGAVANDFHPTQGGAYTVVITDANGCTNTSAAYNYSGVGLENIVASATLIYPNPASVFINIEWQDRQLLESIVIQNTMGVNVLEIHEPFNDKIITIDINNLTPGIYILRCNIPQLTLNYKFVKL